MDGRTDVCMYICKYTCVHEIVYYVCMCVSIMSILFVRMFVDVHKH